MKQNIVIVSGYFNPVHKGHLELFQNAKAHGDKLFVVVNNDFQRNLKGSKKFMLEDERVLIINELRIVDKVVLSIDKDKSVVETLKKIHTDFGRKNKLFFANGGDQDNTSALEFSICKKLDITLIDGLGEKIQSSSWLL